MKFAVKNFLVFQEKVEFELKRITILTGPNGAGKSTFSKLLTFMVSNFHKGIPMLLDLSSLDSKYLQELGSRIEHIYNIDQPIIFWFKNVEIEYSFNKFYKKYLITDLKYFPQDSSENLISKFESNIPWDLSSWERDEGAVHYYKVYILNVGSTNDSVNSLNKQFCDSKFKKTDGLIEIPFTQLSNISKKDLDESNNILSDFCYSYACTSGKDNFFDFYEPSMFPVSKIHVGSDCKSLSLRILDRENLGKNAWAPQLDPNSRIDWIDKMLSITGIADKLIVNCISDDIYKLKLVKGDQIIDLDKTGKGIYHFVFWLIYISARFDYHSYHVDQSENNVFEYLFIEEPETSLHPSLQSKLADTLANIWSINYSEEIEATLVIETHSEYLIRKLQFLVAKRSIEKDNIQLYYFHENFGSVKFKQPINIEIKSDGRLSQAFGSGFLDEANSITLELFKFSNDLDN